MRGRQIVACALAGLVALPASARAGEPRASDGPTAVPVAERGEGEEAAVPQDRAQEAGPEAQVPTNMPEGPAPPTVPTVPAPTVPAPTVPPPGAPLQERVDEVSVAVGLGPTAPGSRAEKQIVDALERSARASAAPRASVRRLRAGTGDGAALCRERRDDLVILVEYLPDRAEPVLLPQDCRTGRALGVRTADAAEHPELVAALWAEHEELVRQGAQERRRGRLGPRVRTGLIAGGAILAVGVAIGIVLVTSLRNETVVLTVSP